MDSYTSNTTDDIAINSDGIDHELSYDDIRDAIVHVVAFLLLVVAVRLYSICQSFGRMKYHTAVMFHIL